MPDGPDIDPTQAEREAERLAPPPPVPAAANPPAGGVRGALRMATIDLRPLRRHRDFRLLFAGQGTSFLGSMITYVALPYQVYHLTGSSLMVGLLGIAELCPLLVTALVGGVLADARDRRRMLQVTELSLAFASGVLLVNALLPEPQLWVLFVVAAAMAGLDGLQRPSLDALEPRLVDRDEIGAAAAISSFRGNIGMIVGPATGGILIATAGLPATYAIDVLTFIVSLSMLRLMRAAPPPPEAASLSLASVVEGFRYASRNQVLVGTYAVDMVAMFFGMPMALYPAFAQEFGGAGVLGLLYAAPSAGSLLATVTSGWTAHVHRHGLAVCWAAAAWGLAICGAGLAPNLALALLGLGAAGAADMISGIFRSTVWNQTIPNELRGRLAGIEQLSYSSGPLLGNLESGVAASLFGVRASIISGGALCAVGVGVAALALPRFRRYDASRRNPPLTD